MSGTRPNPEDPPEGGNPANHPTAGLEEVDIQAEVGELKGDVKRAEADAQLRQELDREQLTQAQQANRLRGQFFVIANGLAGLTVLTSIGLVVATLFGAPIADTVAVAFISALAVETVGILAVIAGYLFPRDRAGSNDQRRAD